MTLNATVLFIALLKCWILITGTIEIPASWLTLPWAMRLSTRCWIANHVIVHSNSVSKFGEVAKTFRSLWLDCVNVHLRSFLFLSSITDSWDSLYPSLVMMSVIWLSTSMSSCTFFKSDILMLIHLVELMCLWLLYSTLEVAVEDENYSMLWRHMNRIGKLQRHCCPSNEYFTELTFECFDRSLIHTIACWSVSLVF